MERPASLANKIRELMAGKNERWWKKRPQLLQLIADDIGHEREALLGGPVAIAGLSFPELPALEPLSLNEEPCHFGEWCWLIHHTVRKLAPGARRWIVAPAGSGKSLVCRYLEQRHDREFNIVAAATLEEALERAASPLPTVVEIEVCDRRTDGAAMGALSGRAEPIVVMAPFAPACSEAGPQWFAAGRRASPRTFSSREFPGWNIYEAVLPDGWRNRLARWIDVRLEQAPDTKFDHAELLAWLEMNDPDEALVGTPGDLLALAAEWHTHGGGAPLVQMATRWTKRILTQPTGAPSDAKIWCRRAGSSAYRTLASTRALDHAPLSRGLAVHEWEGLVPHAVSPGASGAAGETIVVAYLRELGLVRGADDGLLNLYPNWVAAGHAAGALRRLVEQSDSSRWGAFAVDGTRRWMVDAALDGLPLPALCELIRKVVRDGSGDTLAAAGAIETTFAAMARRLTAGPVQPKDRDVSTWQELVELQVALLLPEPSYGNWLVPVTRPALDEWIANAWVVSLGLPRPPTWAEGRLPREFPGWSEVVQMDQFDTPLFPSSCLRGSRYEASAAARCIAARGIDLLRRSMAPEPPPKIPRLLLPAFIMVAPDKGWAVQPDHVVALKSSWEQDYLVEQLSSDTRPAVVAALWGAVTQLATDVASMIELLAHAHRPLLQLLLAQVPEALFTQTLEDHGFAPSSDAFALLPKRLRRIVLSRWVVSEPRLSDARALLVAATPDDLEALLEIAATAGTSLSSELAAAVWRLDPQRARHETTQAIVRNDAGLQGWFWASPLNETAFLATVVNRVSHADWVSRWCRDRLPHGGQAAEVLYQIVRNQRRASAR